MKLHIDISATDGAARRGSVRTSRGSFQTPVFMPVGTRGSIRTLTTHELAGLSSHGPLPASGSAASGSAVSGSAATDADVTVPEIMLCNTYHLMLRPGAETIAQLGGLHSFTGWGSHMLTDSGGFQVFSLDPAVSEDGAIFKSTYDGDTSLLTPEGAVRTQELLGADIQMVLDVCAPLPSDTGVLRAAMERTARWAERARGAHGRTGDQALFGIVQGGDDPDLRIESAQRTIALDFDGYAVGGLSVGESRERMLPALEAALSALPTDQPRYLMGVGDPVSIIEAVALGVDMFDCVLPTRLARHGTLLTDSGRLNIKRAEFATSDEPLDPSCPCVTCTQYSRGYLRHLCRLGEHAGATLCTIHNLTWILGFVAAIRRSIEASTLDDLRVRTAAVWSGSGPGLGT